MNLQLLIQILAIQACYLTPSFPLSFKGEGEVSVREASPP